MFAWVERLISLAVVMQTLELFCLRKALLPQGLWSWEIVSQDFRKLPWPLRGLFDLALRDPNFLFVLGARLLAAILAFFAPSVLVFFVMLITTLLISLRWRGTFNGGSDFMTIVVLMALSVVSLFSNQPQLVRASVWYIALQVCASFFVAGVVKLRRKNWRNGKALIGFIGSTIYEPSPVGASLSKHTRLACAASWIVIGFECSFPAALLNSTICLFYIAFAVAFQLANAYFFGLNRFVLVWAAAYPALYYCSQR